MQKTIDKPVLFSRPDDLKQIHPWISLEDARTLLISFYHFQLGYEGRDKPNDHKDINDLFEKAYQRILTRTKENLIEIINGWV